MAFCNICGTSVPENATNCPVCGSFMATQAAPQAEQQAQPYAAPQAQPYATPQAAPYAAPQASPYAAPQPQPQPQPEPQPQPPVNPYSAQSGQYSNQNPYSQQGAYAQPAPGVQPMMGTDPMKEISTAKTLGIVAIVMAFIWPLVSWICGGIGISKANSVITMARSMADPYLLSTAEEAKKLNKVGIIISLVLTALSFILIIILGAAGVMAGLNY